MRAVCDIIAESAARYAEQWALVWARLGGGGGLTYRGLWEAVLGGAERLRSLGFGGGDRVILFCEPRPEWAAALFAIWEAGLVAVPLALETPVETVGRVAIFAEARGLIVSRRTSALASFMSGVTVVVVEDLTGGPEGSRAVEGGGVRGGGEKDDVALLAFTSGSTRQPRAVELTHSNLVSNLEGLLGVRRACPGESMLSMLPPAHLFELMVGLLGPLGCGARVVYPGTLLPNRLVLVLREEKITHALCVPALLDALYEEVLAELAVAGVVTEGRRGQTVAETVRRLRDEIGEGDRARIREGIRTRVGAQFRVLIVGGAAVDPAWGALAAYAGLRLEVGYGLTEASPIVSLGEAAECPPGSVGRVLPGVEVRVGGSGEVLVRGANVMRGYYRDWEGTQEALDGGWLRTGDRGYMDEDGFLFITGRLKEVMVTAAGETIYPEEAEPFYASPFFAEFCVAGVPGPDGNDRPALFAVVQSPDVSGERLDEALAVMRAGAPAKFRVQRFIRIEQRLPRTATGKVQRRRLVSEWLRGRIAGVEQWR